MEFSGPVTLWNWHILFFFQDLFSIYLFLAVLGLSCGMWDLSWPRGLLSGCGVRVFTL